MKEITQIRSLSIWIFIVPFISINMCLLISVNYLFFFIFFLSVVLLVIFFFSIPYLDGSLSISRASRTFPQFLIFKPSMFVTGLLLCAYWYKNNVLVNNYKKIDSKKNTFMVFGILSAIFLIIHSLFLGVETDIKIFKFLKRLILLSFIIFEIIAQSILVVNFYKLKQQLNNLFVPIVLKFKIILVSVLIFVSLTSVPILINTGNVHFKHGLEWNFFAGVVFFYLLTHFFWKKKN